MRADTSEAPETAMLWLQGVAGARTSASTTAYVHMACLRPEYEVEGSGRLFRAAQLAAPHLTRYLLVTSADITFTEPGLASLFTRISTAKEVRAAYCPLCCALLLTRRCAWPWCAPGWRGPAHMLGTAA